MKNYYEVQKRNHKLKLGGWERSGMANPSRLSDTPWETRKADAIAKAKEAREIFYNLCYRVVLLPRSADPLKVYFKRVKRVVCQWGTFKKS